ncbi:DUF2817 domain-containing protein [Acidovorax sp. SUPP2522]|uniref:M14 family zinc carboxypeptidase n=1 Tax=unclassified Acidovorax TaxID=2684926 RepID=UPI00234A6DC8|nr:MULTISPECIES: M14 family zinc carboxypeptidase [unclassified Acidovorax]WCM97717.1 murein peptide amidase A [Acidovorax sp. GBBC 1281]GKT13327.1 DUF2817 domain-containing protein [Acidovorax sp. SUPP2522]
MSAADRTPRGAAAAALPWLLPLGAALALALMGTRIWNPDLVGGARVPLGEGPATAQVTVPARMAGIQSAVIVQPRSPEAPLPQARTPERGVAPSHAGPGAPHKAAPAPAPAPSPPGTAAVGTAAAEPDTACPLLLPRLPGISKAQCQSAHLVPSGALSRNGIPLYWRDVPPAGLAPGTVPLRVLVVGAMHGDEPTAASLALRWIGFAETRLLPTRRPVHWRFIPALNPDGMLAKPATRVNARGVDLNRNFPTPNWERDAPIYWEKRTRRDPRRWPGPAALSEPESQFLHTQMAQFEPDLVVSIHAPYGVLDFDGPQPPPSRLGRLRLDQLGIFPGSLGHYGSVHLGLPVVTIELQHELRMPQDDEVRVMWRDLLRWMDEHLAVVDGQASPQK